MAQLYAGILGLLALTTVVARGFLHGESADTTLLAGWIAMLAFSALGYVLGRVAQQTVEESLRGRIEGQLRESAENEQRTGSTA